MQKNLKFFVVCNILFYKSIYYNKKLKSKREKFVDLANKRVTSAIDKIRLIGNLSDRRFYEYSEKDSKQIIDALTKELSSVKSKFQNNAKKKDKEFSLDLWGTNYELRKTLLRYCNYRRWWWCQKNLREIFSLG